VEGFFEHVGLWFGDWEGIIGAEWGWGIGDWSVVVFVMNGWWVGSYGCERCVWMRNDIGGGGGVGGGRWESWLRPWRSCLL
jgi:hypothetical protein